MRCLPPAVITQSDATVETWRWEHARESVHVCMVRGVGGVGTHTAQHWVQHQLSAAACGWQSTNKSCVNRPADHG